MNAKHTPGPWEIANGEGVVVYGQPIRTYEVSARDGSFWIAQVQHAVHPTIGAENAHLIAAAPEMYEALEWITKNCDGPAFGKAKAALAKARGETT